MNGQQSTFPSSQGLLAIQGTISIFPGTQTFLSTFFGTIHEGEKEEEEEKKGEEENHC